jgi:hypothetical protein
VLLEVLDMMLAAMDAKLVREERWGNVGWVVALALGMIGIVY